MDKKFPAVYMLASHRNGTLYVGVTSDLPRRIWQHKSDLVGGFTKRHQIHSLVYYEMFDEMIPAIEWEKRLKKWDRSWKIELIQETNPKWKDLYSELFD